MEAAKRSISDIFNGNRVLEIPFFQRSYVWNEEQWQRLLDDMEDITKFDKKLFLGSVILKQQPTGTKGSTGDIRTLIDGQQRLTTLNIFFKVLCLMNDENNIFKRMFGLLDDSLALRHNHNDIESFDNVLQLTTLESLDEDNNIVNAYNFFKKNINLDRVDRQKIINNMMFVAVDLDSTDNEQQIFDSINSLGVRLTTAELLKNYFFDRRDLEDFELYWKNIFEENSEVKAYWDREITTGRVTRAVIDIFFHSFLQIRIQDKSLNVSSKEKDEFSKVEELFSSYKRFIQNCNLDKKELLSEIKEYALIFKDNFDIEIINNELPRTGGIERVNAIIFGLETTTLIPYILYVLKNTSNEKEKIALFEVLESYLLRRIIVKAVNKNYNQFFTDSLISNQVLSKNEFVGFLENSSDKVNYFPNDDELKKGFCDSKFINKQATGILYLIETKIRSKKHSSQLLGMNKYSLEHLMPKKWTNHWGELSTENEISIRNKKLLTIGNLAIITQSLNASIRDSDWETKVNGRESKKGLKHYSSEIETLANALDLSEWNEEEIDKRAEVLFDHAKEIWKRG